MTLKAFFSDLFRAEWLPHEAAILLSAAEAGHPGLSCCFIA
jgi:hypothetical protein